MCTVKSAQRFKFNESDTINLSLSLRLTQLMLPLLDPPLLLSLQRPRRELNTY